MFKFLSPNLLTSHCASDSLSIPLLVHLLKHPPVWTKLYFTVLPLLRFTMLPLFIHSFEPFSQHFVLCFNRSSVVLFMLRSILLLLCFFDPLFFKCFIPLSCILLTHPLPLLWVQSIIHCSRTSSSGLFAVTILRFSVSLYHIFCFLHVSISHLLCLPFHRPTVLSALLPFSHCTIHNSEL